MWLRERLVRLLPWRQRDRVVRAQYVTGAACKTPGGTARLSPLNDYVTKRTSWSAVRASTPNM